MELLDLSTKLIYWIDQGYPLTSELYPTELRLRSDVWAAVRDTRRYTDKGSEHMLNRYKDYRGSLGYEYAFSLAYIVDQLYVGGLISGSWREVNAQLSVSIKLEDSKHGQEFVHQERYLNGSMIGSLDIARSQLPDKLHYGFVAHFHTHPRQALGNGSFVYSFFSEDDFVAIAKNRLPLWGLITDKLYLVGKTEKFNLATIRSLHFSINELTNSAELNRALQQQLKDSGLVLYFAEHFGDTLQRII